MEISINIIPEGAAKEFLRNEHPVLTVAKARELVGKKIRWTHPCDRENRQCVYENTIKEIITRYDYAKRLGCNGYASLADYWDAKLQSYAKVARQTWLVIDACGVRTGMFSEDNANLGEPTFVCSDSGRVVTFEVV